MVDAENRLVYLSFKGQRALLHSTTRQRTAQRSTVQYKCQSTGQTPGGTGSTPTGLCLQTHGWQVKPKQSQPTDCRLCTCNHRSAGRKTSPPTPSTGQTVEIQRARAKQRGDAEDKPQLQRQTSVRKITRTCPTGARRQGPGHVLGPVVRVKQVHIHGARNGLSSGRVFGYAWRLGTTGPTGLLRCPKSPIECVCVCVCVCVRRGRHTNGALHAMPCHTWRS